MIMALMPMSHSLLYKFVRFKCSSKYCSPVLNDCFKVCRNHFYLFVSKKCFSTETETNNVYSKSISGVNKVPEEMGQIPTITKEIKKLKYKDDFSIQDVETLRNSVLNKGRHVTKINFDSLFMTLCGNEKAFQIGKEYFKFLNSKGSNNIGIIGKFFRLCYNCREQCSQSEKNLMIDLYMKLLNKYEIFDFKTCENVALGLSITSDWKECLKLLEMSRFTSTPSSKMYSAIIQAAFSNNDIDLGLNLLHEMANGRLTPDLEVYSSWLSALKFSKVTFNDIFKFFEKYDLHITEDVISLLLTYYEKYHSKPKYAEVTTINSSGKCRSCSHKLNKLVLSESEFNKLKDAFLNPVLIGKDIFLKTKPSEFESYINFLKNIKHIDVVLDGLNIALSPTQKRSYSGLPAEVLCNVVKHLVMQSKKVLVLGRKHMNLWPPKNLNYIKQNAFLFLVDNISSDDPFLLYAAMFFGLGTGFVSRDQMRSHKFLLRDPELVSIFLKWQQKHQYYFLNTGKDGSVSLKDPLTYLQSAHRIKLGIWHIPISSDLTGVPAYRIPIKRKWLCFQEN